jgi:hypothetical protein
MEGGIMNEIMDGKCDKPGGTVGRELQGLLGDGPNLKGLNPTPAAMEVGDARRRSRL